MNLPRYRKNRCDWRRHGQFLLRLVAGGCAGLVLVLCILAASPEAHHWLHHDSDNPDHACAVVVFAHGLTPSGGKVAVAAILLFLVTGLIARYRGPDIPAPWYALQPGRGPPVA